MTRVDVLAAALAIACAACSSPRRDLQPVALPNMTSVDAPVQRQIKDQYGTLTQAIPPEEYRGRVQAAFSLIFSAPLTLAIGLAGVLLQAFSNALVVTGYELNKEYIANHLCVNRDKPKMHCNGCCHLKKELAQNEKQQEREIGSAPEHGLVRRYQLLRLPMALISA